MSEQIRQEDQIIKQKMEKIEELKIDFSNNKELEPLIIIQYVSEDFINSMVLLKDLNNIFLILN